MSTSPKGGTNRRIQFQNSSGGNNVLAAVPLDGSGATLTLTLAVDGLDYVDLAMQCTRVAFTDVIVTPTVSLDNGTTYSASQTEANSAGTVTLTPANKRRTVSATFTAVARFKVGAATHLKLVVTSTAAGATDLITAQARGAVGAVAVEV